MGVRNTARRTAAVALRRRGEVVCAHAIRPSGCTVVRTAPSQPRTVVPGGGRSKLLQNSTSFRTWLVHVLYVLSCLPGSKQKTSPPPWRATKRGSSKQKEADRLKHPPANHPHENKQKAGIPGRSCRRENGDRAGDTEPKSNRARRPERPPLKRRKHNTKQYSARDGPRPQDARKSNTLSL